MICSTYDIGADQGSCIRNHALAYLIHESVCGSIQSAGDAIVQNILKALLLSYDSVQKVVTIDMRRLRNLQVDKVVNAQICDTHELLVKINPQGSVFSSVM